MSEIFEVKRERILETIDTLIASLKALESKLRSDDQLQPIIQYRLPIRGTESVPDQLEIEVLLDVEEAKSEAVACLCEPYMRPGQSSRETVRAPGLIKVSEETVKVIKSVNREKLILSAMIDEIPPRQRRNIYRLRKNVSMIQLKRIIEIVPSECSSLNFYWYSYPSISKIRAGDVRDELLATLIEYTGDESINLRNIPDPKDIPGDFERGIILDIYAISSVPEDEVVAYIRPTQPHVRAWMKVENGDSPYIQSVCSAPIVYYGVGPKLTGAMLDDCDTKSIMADKWPKSFEQEPLIESKNIYRYLSGRRKFQSNAVTHKANIRKRDPELYISEE